LNNNLSNSVINMSLGGGGDTPLDQAVLTAADQGVRFAIAAGNSFQDVDTTSPARTGSHPNVYTISAVDANYQLASFSNYDNVAPGSTDKVDYAQPGVRVISWYRNASNGTYSLYYLDGTSMAAPHAAGALLMGGLSGSDLVTTPSGIQSDPFGLVNAVSTPSISIQAVDASKAEGSSGQPTPFTFQLDRSGLDLSASSSVQWQIQDGTTDLSDFSGPLSGTLQFQPGEQTKALSIDVAGDTLFEPDETFSVQLLNPSNAILATSLASATIINDDPAPPGGGNHGKPDLYFTLSSSLTAINPAIMNGLTADQNDIIGFRSSNQTFERSLDVVVDSLTGLAIDGFSFRPDGALLVTLKNATTINGINYDDSDIFLLKSSSGAYTAEMYFDGSDVGLSTSSEAIDAFTLDGGGNLLISTRGSFSVNGASGFREDILKFRPTSTGSQTSGAWSIYFDGSDVGLTTSSENVNGIALDLLGKLYLTTTGNFSVNGLTGANEDVFRFSFTGSPGSNTAGTFESTLFFDGSLYGLSNYMLAGFDLPLPS
ncbi:MAG: S8 family serine peptidase, partial [Cyanobacteria bacterium]|nr:S8 family serine peptidase [Cyanobacteriota bacterium]